jgi:hypothetical protein
MEKAQQQIAEYQKQQQQITEQFEKLRINYLQLDGAIAALQNLIDNEEETNDGENELPKG